MYIIGINAYHADSSACILKDGKLITAVEEERFTRIKHFAGFPKLSIQHCLDECKISLLPCDSLLREFLEMRQWRDLCPLGIRG